MKIGYLCALLVSLTGCGELATDDATSAASSRGEDDAVVDTGSAGEPCVADGPVHAFSSSDDVRARVTGIWRMCTGTKIALSPRDAEGFALTKTDVEFLFPLADGGLGEADDSSVIGTFDVEGNGPWQVLFVVGASTSTFDAQVSEDGRILNLDDASRGVRSTFVRAR